MNLTPNAPQQLLRIARKIGATDYLATGSRPVTLYMARLRLPNSRPMVIQFNKRTPMIWMLPEHEDRLLIGLGPQRPYAADEGRHSNLQQVREFKKRSLVKTSVTTSDWDLVEAALAAVGSPGRAVAA